MNDINLCKAEKSLYFKKISKKNDLDLKKDEKYDGYLIDTNNNEKETRRILDTLKQTKTNKKLAVIGGDNHYNRRILETMKINYLVSPEKETTKHKKKDTLKQRDSGLNHVLSKIATKNKIGIIIDYNDLTNQTTKEKTKRIARIIQNIKICKKTKTTINIASLAKTKKNIKDTTTRKALGTSLGMSDKQSKQAIEF